MTAETRTLNGRQLLNLTADLWTFEIGGIRQIPQSGYISKAQKMGNTATTDVLLVG